MIGKKMMRVSLLSLALLFCVSVSNLLAQESCTMVCAGELNTQLDGTSCEAVISYLDLIPDPCYDSDYVVKIKTLNNSVIAEGEKSVVVSELGRYIYQVTYDGGDTPISCWGYITFEDKNAPYKELQGDQEPATVVCGQPSEDPSGVDDLATELVSCVVKDTYGEDALEPWFDVLDIDDFKDCSGIDKVFNYTEKIDLCKDHSGEVEAALAEVTMPLGWEPCYAYKRSWFASDATGRLSDTCAQFVIVARPQAKRIIISGQGKAECGDDNPEKESYPYFTDLFNTNDFFTCPSTAGQKQIIEPSSHFCKYAVSVHYGDKIALCDTDVSKVYKRSAHWTVVDWCTGEHVFGNNGNDEFDEFTTFVEVYDSKAPVPFGTPVNNVTTSLFDCEGSLVVGPQEFDDCSGIASVITTAEYIIPGAHGGSVLFKKVSVEGNGITLAEVPLNANINITYEATDFCGNIGYAEHSVFAYDDRSPVCIANDELFVSMIRLDHTGVNLDSVGARVYGEDLDDTSRDNCFPVILEVRRADQAAVSADPESLWAEYVEFTKEDLTLAGGCKGEYKVELRVTEDRGQVNGVAPQYSTCWTNIVIEDRNAPVVEVEEDKFSSCTHPHYDFDEAVVSGCYAGIDMRIDTLSNDECDYDVVLHLRKVWKPYFIHHDAKAYTDSAFQNLYIQNVHDSKFTFPIDQVIDCSMASIPDPVAIDDIINESGCSSWFMEVEDREFASNDADACSKILRRYSFINWCTWDPSNTELATVTRPEAGVWSIEEQVMLHYRDADLDGVNDIDDMYDGDIYDIEVSEHGYESDAAWVQVDRGDRVQGQQTFAHREDIRGLNVSSVDAYHYGYFSYTQVIKIQDDEAPVSAAPEIKQSCNPLEVDCELPTLVEMTFGGTDNCSALFYDIQLQPFQTGAYVNDPYGTLTGNVYAGYYPGGTHNFIITTADGCGNAVSDTLAVEVADECKKPTPVCYATFTATMEDGSVDIWASDIESGSSTDNCSDYDELVFTLEVLSDRNGDSYIDHQDASDTAPASDVISLDCSHVGVAIVALWAIDAAGNEQYCTVPVTVFDLADVCANQRARVSGAIVNENDEEIDQVTVEVAADGMNSVAQIFNGFFDFISIPMHNDVTVTPIKDLGTLNGVSTSDLVLLQRHILGVSSLTSPYKLIAADANRDDKVDTRDILQISRLILGIYDELPNNTSWRFVSKDHTFANPTSPWGFPESNSYANLDSDIEHGFIGVKVGDISGNAKPNNLLGDDSVDALRTVSLETANQKLVAGQSATISFSADAMNEVAGYQFTLELTDDVVFQGLTFGPDSELTEANFGLNKLDQNMITVSWSQVEASDIKKGTELFSIDLATVANTSVQEAINMNSAFTAAEAYDNELNTLDIMLNVTSLDDAFELYQNIPNPVSNETIIGFNLPEAGQASLKIMDVSGRVLKTIQGTYPSGYNQITLDRSDLGSAGILYYQLDANQSSASKKMIIID